MGDILVHKLAVKSAKDVTVAASQSPVTGWRAYPSFLVSSTGRLSIQARRALLGCSKYLISTGREWKVKYPAFLPAKVINLYRSFWKPFVNQAAAL